MVENVFNIHPEKEAGFTDLQAALFMLIPSLGFLTKHQLPANERQVTRGGSSMSTSKSGVIGKPPII